MRGMGSLLTLAHGLNKVLRNPPSLQQLPHLLPENGLARRHLGGILWIRGIHHYIHVRPLRTLEGLRHERPELLALELLDDTDRARPILQPQCPQHLAVE